MNNTTECNRDCPNCTIQPNELYRAVCAGNIARVIQIEEVLPLLKQIVSKLDNQPVEKTDPIADFTPVVLTADVETEIEVENETLTEKDED